MSLSRSCFVFRSRGKGGSAAVGIGSNNSPSISIMQMQTVDVRPNHTIYINNLNEKVKKEGED
jgi:hypothetical protein